MKSQAVELEQSGEEMGAKLIPEKSISWTTYQWGPNSLGVGGREKSM